MYEEYMRVPLSIFYYFSSIFAPRRKRPQIVLPLICEYSFVFGFYTSIEIVFDRFT